MAKAASRCCELANPAQVRQIASQTGVLLCRMRFVAGRGADKACCWQRRCGEAVAGRGPSAQRTAGRGAAAESLREDTAGREAPWRSCWQGRRGREWEAGTATSTGKESTLPEGSTIGKQARKEPLLQARKEPPRQARKEPQLQARKEPPRAASEQKRERQNPLS